MESAALAGPFFFFTRGIEDDVDHGSSLDDLGISRHTYDLYV